MKMQLLTLLGVLLLTSACSESPKRDDEFNVDEMLAYCVEKTILSLNHLPSVDSLPRNIYPHEEQWNLVGIHDWTSGFWPGVLWYAYEASGDKRLATAAARYTKMLRGVLEVPVDNHDLGFMLYNSAGNGYRLTGDEHFKHMAMTAADSLASLYNPRVGTILSWPAMREKMNWPHNTIIDNMINLELLFWASGQGNRAHLYDMAVSHADACLNTLVREDFSTYHVAVFDSTDGRFIKGVTHQGLNDESLWARGQAWGVYGYTMAFRETEKRSYLAAAMRLADVFLAGLPEDGIPYWDYNDPNIPDAPKDASAAAVAASGLLELSSHLHGKDAQRYFEAGLELVKNLSKAPYLSGAHNHSFLLHSTGHFPNGYEIDASIIYADYYYLEALLRLKKMQESQVISYVAPEGALLNDDYTVEVREPEGEWQELPSYLVKVDEVVGSQHEVKDASMAFFDFKGKAEVRISYNVGKVETIQVRPLSYQIRPQVEGDAITFELNQPANLSVEINGDIFHNLHLFANPIEENKPSPDDENVIWFGHGIHELENGALEVPSGTTVYVAGDAVLRGQLLVHDARDVVIRGRGMVEHTVKMGIHIANSTNVQVEGLFTTQCATGGSDSVQITNVKSISYFGWGDGLNVFASNNVLFDRVFCRNSDDCTTVYATRKGFEGGCRNIVMQNSTLWADVAHPIFIGIHGNSEYPEVIEDLRYSNIDILDHKEMQVDYQGCLSINAGDNNLIRKVLFEDIRIEDFRQGQLVNLRIFFNEKYCTAPGRGIEDITFRNISYKGQNSEISLIAGYNEERKVKNIVFENLEINGVKVTDSMAGKPSWYKTADMARISVGEHVENVVFR